MLAYLAGLLENVNVLLAELRVRIGGIVLIDQLRQPQGARHASRTATDDDDVGGHLGAFNIC